MLHNIPHHFTMIIPVGVLCLVGLCNSHSMVAEYKKLDKKVMDFLLRPVSEEQWDEMLKTAEYYIYKVMNYGLRISQEMETDKIMVNKIVNGGKPRFINVTLNEQVLIEEMCIPKKKITEFYELCDELRRTWVEFVKIAKAMKWQKKTRRPFIVQCAFHGRRLGRRKGGKKPYVPRDSIESKFNTKELGLSSYHDSFKRSEYDN